MDNHFWAYEAARLYREGYTVKKAIVVMEAEKEDFERSRNHVEENMDTRTGRIPSK